MEDGPGRGAFERGGAAAVRLTGLLRETARRAAGAVGGQAGLGADFPQRQMAGPDVELADGRREELGARQAARPGRRVACRAGEHLLWRPLLTVMHLCAELPPQTTGMTNATDGADTGTKPGSATRLYLTASVPGTHCPRINP